MALEEFLNTNEDMFVTIPENVEDDAKELKQGDKVLVWYDFVGNEHAWTSYSYKSSYLRLIIVKR